MPLVNSNYSAFGCPQVSISGINGITQSVTVREFADPAEVHDAQLTLNTFYELPTTPYVEVNVVTLMRGFASDTRR